MQGLVAQAPEQQQRHDDRQGCGDNRLAQQLGVTGAPGSVPAVTSPASLWLRVPIGSTATKLSHQMTKKTAMIEPIGMLMVLEFDVIAGAERPAEGAAAWPRLVRIDATYTRCTNTETLGLRPQ